jgi:spermidine synthase
LSSPRAVFYVGLFLATLATLALEILDTRLLSVVTWYHLSFFAVSTALFGMSAGSLRVYLGGERFAAERAPAELARAATFFALSIPLSHAVALAVPVPPELTATSVAALATLTAAIAVPFYLSGVLVALALTRIPAPSGRVYAVDLLGAALGSVLVLGLLAVTDISSAAIACGALAAVSAACFQRFAGHAYGARVAAALAFFLVMAALANARAPERGLRVAFYKTGTVPRSGIIDERWTIHGQVTVRRAAEGQPQYWGAGIGTDGYRVNRTPLLIDGAAATMMTRWQGGSREALAWVAHDVTSLAFHLRPGGEVAVIGVGGGRDLLTAIWAGSRQVTGIEVNRAFLDLLQGRFRGYAGIADRPEVRLVHDEARSWLTRTGERFDVIQMSLIDTWAATGAGAFTLSENGLYTVEAWKVFLDALKPNGLLAVSRWHAPGKVSETSRLLSLAAASLLERGVADPSAHLALVSAGTVAILLASPSPLASADVARLRAVGEAFGFRVLLAPGAPAADSVMQRIVTSPTRETLERAVADEAFDYSPPTDRRPYFFNLLRPASFLRGLALPAGVQSVTAGNIQATSTLVVLWILSALLVGLVIFAPLARAGLPIQGRHGFRNAAAYFALIGVGFMLVQIPLVQRFSVYLGHPTYAVSVVLFSMILAAGAGSLASDLVPIERRRGWLLALPLAIAVLLVGVALSLQSLIDATIARGLVVRCATAVAVVAIPAFLMGTCLPYGLRLVRRQGEAALPWMWGINGACSVLAAVSAIGLSMTWGIDANLGIAASCYAALAYFGVSLARAPA